MTRDVEDWAPVIVAAAGLTMQVAAGMRLTVLDSWYKDLKKPSWQPPDFLFPIAWTLIFICEAASAVIGWHAIHGFWRLTLFVALYVVNGILNMAWSYFFFKIRRPDFARIEVPFLWLSIAAPMVMLYIYAGSSWILLLPYLLWVSFAAVLNNRIVQLNKPFTGVK